MSDEEIVQRLVFGMVNEAAYILQEGIAHKASDIDVVCTLGCGFPAHRGGPLCYANELGLAHVVATIQRFAQNPQGCAQDSGQPGSPEQQTPSWQPAPLLAQWLRKAGAFKERVARRPAFYSRLALLSACACEVPEQWGQS